MWWLELHVLLLRNAIFKTFSSHFYNKFHMIGYCLLLLCDRLLLTITNEKKNNFNCKFKGKLHFTTLNYTPDYTLHHKLFEWTFCSLNYDICYTSHPNIKFRVTMDGMLNHMTPTWLLLKCHQVKRPKCPLPSPKTQKTLHGFSVSVLPSHSRFGVLGLSMNRSTQIGRDKG